MILYFSETAFKSKINIYYTIRVHLGPKNLVTHTRVAITNRINRYNN